MRKCVPKLNFAHTDRLCFPACAFSMIRLNVSQRVSNLTATISPTDLKTNRVFFSIKLYLLGFPRWDRGETNSKWTEGFGFRKKTNLLIKSNRGNPLEVGLCACYQIPVWMISKHLGFCSDPFSRGWVELCNVSSDIRIIQTIVP